MVSLNIVIRVPSNLHSVSGRIVTCGFRLMTKRLFTDDQDQFIISNVSTMTSGQVAKALGMKPNSVKNRARVLGVRFSAGVPDWTEKQDALLRNMAGYHPVSQIAAACRRSSEAVINRAYDKGLSLAYERKPYKKLTTAHIKEARRLRDIGLSYNQVAQVMYLSKSTVMYLLKENK
ncbi:MAG: hypothetical protein [Siphoviridae sp. ctdc_1]|nr:MAG: hypothetical protein [Siphoviridae sp. ctdc_1]